MASWGLFARTAGDGADDAQLRRVVEYIHEHFRERLAVSALAKMVPLSDRQLNRRFQRTVSMSTQRFLLRTRIQAASAARQRRAGN